MGHHPVQIGLATASQQIAGEVSGIVVPDIVIQRQNPVAIENIEDILIGKNELPGMFSGIGEELLRADFFSSTLQINEQDAGIIVLVLCLQPKAVGQRQQKDFPAGLSPKAGGSD